MYLISRESLLNQGCLLIVFVFVLIVSISKLINPMGFCLLEFITNMAMSFLMNFILFDL